MSATAGNYRGSGWISYRGRTYELSPNSPFKGAVRGVESGIVFNMKERLYQISKWNGDPIQFVGLARHKNELFYNPMSGMISHLPTGRNVLLMESGLNPRRLRAAIRVR